MFSPRGARFKSAIRAKNRISRLQTDVETELYELLGVEEISEGILRQRKPDHISDSDGSVVGDGMTSTTGPKHREHPDGAGQKVSRKREAKQAAKKNIAAQFYKKGKEIGDLVYCIWSINGEFYWGRIRDIWQDGDELHYKVS